MYNFPMLREGSEDSLSITIAQGMLYDLGFMDHANGVFDAETKEAVIDFQKRYSLEYVDGIIGNETWRRLIGEWWCSI